MNLSIIKTIWKNKMDKKNIIFCILGIFSTLNSHACCGCAVVESAMTNLNSTFERSLEQYDNLSSKIYENNILAKINSSMINLNNNFTALKNNTIIESLNTTCIDEINQQIKKSIELKNLSKTQKVIIEFEKK